MTEKDREIQQLRQKISALRQEVKHLELEKAGMLEEIGLMVETAQNCRFCAHIHADCTPGTEECNPKWRGIKNA